MCNKLHSPFKNISKEGIAYKIFAAGYVQFIKKDSYVTSDDNWIKWNNHCDGNGFCMFETENEAKEALRLFFIGYYQKEGTVISKVEYRKGLGICKERNFVGGSIDILIAKEFKIISEEG